MMSDKDILVMVYGTLKQGQYNHVYMQDIDAEFIDNVVSKESIYQMVGVGDAFPGIIAGDKQFQGELYRVPLDGVLGALDYLEGYPVMYTRGFITVKSMTNGKEYSALVYFLTQSFIESTQIELESPYIRLEGNIYNWE